MKNRTPASLRSAANSKALTSSKASNVTDNDAFKMSDLLSGLASLSKQVSSSLNSYEVRRLGDKVQGYVLNFTEVELRVREATNEDPWGPTGPQIQEIASLTNQYGAFSEVMGMLWKRMLTDTKLAWRRVYKSLMLLQGLIKMGNEKVISNARDHVFEMRVLESYKCIDERGRDQGVNIRHRVKQIIELLQDEELLAEERRKARGENKDKYQGYSKEDMMMGGSSSRQSKFDSWDDKKDSWSKKSSSGGFDLPEPKSSREVSSFDFDDSRTKTASPELGIPDNSHFTNDDDDGFGDFASARSTNPNAAQGSAYNTLGLTRATAAAKTPEPDLFGGFSSPPPASRPKLPNPPSGPSSPVQKQQNIFDLDFGAPAQAPAPSSNLGGLSATNDLFSAAPAVTPAFDLFGSPQSAPVQQAAPVQQQPKQEFDIFGDFSSTPTPVQAQPIQPQPTSLNNDFDLFASAPSATPVAQPQPSNWGQLAQPQPVQSNGNNNTSQPKNDTWSFMEQQLNGLTLGPTEKKAPSMNDMVRR